MQVIKLIVGITAEGSVNLLPDQLKYFKEQGYDTYLLAPWSERVVSFCEREGCKHLQIPIKREISLISDLLNLFRIIYIFWKVKPDIINLGTPKVSLLGMLAGTLLGIKCRIYTCRGFRFEHEQGFQRTILVAMERLTVWAAHQVICISPSVRELGIKNNIFDAQKSLVIHKGSSNGVDLSLFHPNIHDQINIKRLKATLGLEDKLVYGFIGRVVDRKGIRELLTAIDKLFIENRDIALLIVGPVEENQLKDKRLVKDLENHSAVIMTGRKMQEEIPKYIALLDVFVLPAWWEGFGNVLIQAAAMGVPVISTYGTGSRDAVSEGYNGLLVPIKDEIALHKAMQKLFVDREYAKKLGQNGIEWAKNFRQEIIWEGMNDIFKKQLGEDVPKQDKTLV